MSMFEATLSEQQIDLTTAYATVSGLALTPGAGTYLAIFNTVVGSAAVNYTYVGLAVDGSDIAESEREHFHESSIQDSALACEMWTHAIITVGAGEEIQARWKSSTAANRYGKSGALTLISVVPGDTDSVGSVTNDTSINTTPAQVDDMLFTTPGAGDYLLVFDCSVRCEISDTLHIAVYVGGVEVAHTERRYFCESSLTAVTSWQVGFACKVSPGASDDVQIYAWTSVETGGIIHERTASLLGNRSSILEVNDATTPDTESTADTDKAIDDLTHINPAAGDYLAIGSGNFSYGSIGVNCATTLKLFEETTEVTNSARSFVWGDSLDNMDRSLLLAQQVSPSGAEDVSLQWRGSNTEQRTVEERTFVLLLDVAAASRDQEGFRFRDDDADEDEATWLDDQDVNITRSKETNTRVRVLVDTDTADPPAEGMQLEYRKVGDAATEWRKVPLP